MLLPFGPQPQAKSIEQGAFSGVACSFQPTDADTWVVMAWLYMVACCLWASVGRLRLGIRWGVRLWWWCGWAGRVWEGDGYMVRWKGGRGVVGLGVQWCFRVGRRAHGMQTARFLTMIIYCVR